MSQTIYRELFIKIPRTKETNIRKKRKLYNHGGTWSNRTYVALALFSLLATCVVF